MDGTIIGQGTFVSTYPSNPNAGSASVTFASPVIIQIPSQADWVMVRDYTQAGTAGSDAAYFNGVAGGASYPAIEWYWQRGMPAGSAMLKYYSNASTAVNGDALVAGGFTLYDPTGQSLGSQPVVGNPVATTASTNATRPVVSTANTAGVSVGTVVRMSNTAQTDVNAIDMVVGAVTANTSFTLLTATNALATAPGVIGGAGFYRIINADSLYYPRKRFVTNITQATNAQVSTSVAHGLTPGQEVDFSIPAQSGMIQLNPDPVNNYYPTGNSSRPIILTVVDAYNFTININTSAMAAFTWPTVAQQPSSFPIVVPVGEDTATSLSATGAQVPLDWLGNPIFNANTGLLADSVVNTGYYGMILGGGGNGTELTTPISGPSGTVAYTSGNVPTGDTMYWVAGKSTYGGL